MDSKGYKITDKNSNGVVFTEYIAHIREDGREQTVLEHLKESAAIAADCLSPCGLTKTAYLSGLLHDLGKYTNEFQQYIRGSVAAPRGSVIHSFQGCQLILRNYHESEDVFERLTAEIIAYAIGAHHGLFDCVDSSGRLGLDYRKEKNGIGFKEAEAVFASEVCKKAELDKCFSEAVEEIKRIGQRLNGLFPDDKEYYFNIGLIERLVLSAVLEGDRRSTAEFINGVTFPKTAENMRPIWDSRLAQVESRLSEFNDDSPIAAARGRISNACASAAKKPCGIYRLEVPTGGGKTLSALRYALAHASEYNKKRIVFTSPLLSILEQNAAVIRDYIGDDSIVLEHHSNVVREAEGEDALDERELFIQTWEAPVIITTMVQLLNTLFDGKASSIRRFNSLCDSIIVIDEIQTVPAKMLTLFNLAIQFLSELCGATVILCSATQPDFAKAKHPICSEIAKLIPADEELYKVFRRTSLDRLPPIREEEAPSLVGKLMGNTDSLLVVCNKKAEAARLAKKFASSELSVFHLSASMCVQHRRGTVDALKKSLKDGKKTLCISTQVIEAGVDISFQCVLRFAAGMDSVVQAAGRCNRNGESQEPRPVYLVDVSDEMLGSLPEILMGKISTNALLDEFDRNPQRFGNDLTSAAAISFYYEKLYSEMNGNAQDFPVGSFTIFDLLSQNEKYADADIPNIESYCLLQAFKTAGQRFEVFDNSATDILVPYGRGKELIEELCSSRADKAAEYRSALLKEAGAYTVSVYDNQLKQLIKKRAVYPVCGGLALALAEEYYDKQLGLVEESAENIFLEV